MSIARPALILTAMFAAFGCAPPNAANIALRKQLQDADEEIGRLKRQVVANAATTGPASSPVLSAGQQESLFTTHGIHLGRLTGIDDKRLMVYLVPTDVDEDPLKAAGAITVDAFDLADNGRAIGRWTFDAQQTRAMWNGTALRYEYVVPCPLAETPRRELTIKVTFVDALTGRSFSEQTVVAPRPEG